jgi:hypothetical protein
MTIFECTKGYYDRRRLYVALNMLGAQRFRSNCRPSELTAGRTFVPSLALRLTSYPKHSSDRRTHEVASGQSVAGLRSTKDPQH